VNQCVHCGRLLGLRQVPAVCEAGAAGGHVAIAGAVGVIGYPEGEQLPRLQMELQPAWLTGQRREICAGRPFHLSACAVHTERSARIGAQPFHSFPVTVQHRHPQFALRPKMPDLDLLDIPWHQDLAYLIPAEAGETLVVNYWIPLVSATEQNGCMQVIPGSHLQGLIEHNLWLETPGHKGARGIADADLPASSIVTCEVDPGDVLITMERLVHRSIPNRSQTVRWSVDTRYSRIGLPTGRSKVPGFVARSRQHPDRVAGSHDDWIQNLADAGLDRWLQPLQD